MKKSTKYEFLGVVSSALAMPAALLFFILLFSSIVEHEMMFLPHLIALFLAAAGAFALSIGSFVRYNTLKMNEQKKMLDDERKRNLEMLAHDAEMGKQPKRKVSQNVEKTQQKNKKKSLHRKEM